MSNHPNRSAALIRSRSASSVPGDDLREMTADATDDTGRTWPRGTKFRPLSFGGDGHGGRYQTVTVLSDGMHRVTFRAA